MILGVIVFSLLFITFIVFGTLLIIKKGYWLVSGYKTLTEEEKKEFLAKNDVNKLFYFYAYYCFAVAGILILALIGAAISNMIIIFISYLLFGAGTIASLIVVNFNPTFKIRPVEKKEVVIIDAEKKSETSIKDTEKKPEVIEVIKKKKIQETKKDDKK